MASKMAALTTGKLPRNAGFSQLLRHFSDAARRMDIGHFNNIILYGKPRISHSTLDANDSKKDLAPLVILHGMFGSKSNWNSLAKALNKKTGRQVVTFDARNHGESEHHISMTYEAMTYDTLKLLEKLMIKRCVIIGHSMGGKTVMSTALRNPEFIEKLIVVDSAPKTSIAAGAAVTCLKAMMALDTDQVTTKRQANEALRDGIKDDGVRQFILTNLEQSSLGVRWKINLQFFKKNLQNLLEFPNYDGLQYEGPTLFIAGKDSDYITEKEKPEIRRLFPHSEITYIENAGHWVHSDQPSMFLDTVINFL